MSMDVKKTRQTAYKYDCEIAVAFQQDCEKLLKTYDSLKTTAYSKFCDIWKEMHFTFVFSDFERALPLMEFVDNCFFTVKKFIVFPKSKFIQVGAFFLLYGLYYKQPLEHWVKIRVTLDEFKVLKALVMQAKQDLDPIILFIFAKMLQDNAFQYVATKRPMGFEDRYSRTVHNYEDDTFQQRASETVFQSFNKLMDNNTGIIKQLEETEQKYNELQLLCPNECKGLLKPNTSIIDELKTLYNDINNIGQPKAEEQTTSQETLVKKRTKIKQKAMNMQNAVYRGERKVIVGKSGVVAKLEKPE